ncbi:MAG: PEP-CTERM sorting domain-containing protein [Microcoleus sp.]
MCTPLAKLAIGIWAAMATGFYYLAAAPPASAQIDVCGPGNFSSACAPNNTPSPQSAASRSAASRSAPQPTPAVIADPVPSPVVQSPAVIADPVPPPVVQSPAVIADPVPPPVVQSPAVIADPVPSPVVQSPAVIADPVPPLVVQSPAVIADPVPSPVVQSPAVIADPIPPLPVVQPTASPSFANIYINAPSVRSTAIPEPGTAIALLLTGAGMICGGRKRNKQVGQQR